MAYLDIDCVTCEETIELKVDEEFGALYHDDECPNCGARFDRFMRDRIARTYADEETFDNVVGR